VIKRRWVCLSSYDPVMISHHQVSKTDDGLEAVVFTAQGDMRQVSVRVFVYTHTYRDGCVCIVCVYV